MKLKLHVEGPGHSECAQDSKVDILNSVAVKLETNEYLDVIGSALAQIRPKSQNLLAQMQRRLMLLSLIESKNFYH